MTRDLDLARAILLELEKREQFDQHFRMTLPGYADALVDYHLRLLHEGGLICGVVGSINGDVHPIRLTWAGHDFLDSSRNEDAWRYAKSTAGKVGTVGFDVLKALLIQWAKDQLGV